MKITIRLLACLLALSFLFTGCKEEKKEEPPLDVSKARGEFKTVIGNGKLEGTSFGGSYENEFFGVKAEFGNDLECRKESEQNEFRAVNSERTIDVAVNVFTRDDMHESYKHLPSDTICRDKIRYAIENTEGKIIEDAHRETFTYLGEKREAYAALCEQTRHDNGEKQRNYVMFLITDIDSYMMQIFLLAPSKEDCQKFLDEHFFVMK